MAEGRGKGSVVVSGSVPMELKEAWAKKAEGQKISYSSWLQKQMRLYVEGDFDDAREGKLNALYEEFKEWAPRKVHPEYVKGWLTGPSWKEELSRVHMTPITFFDWCQRRISLEDGASKELRMAVGLEMSPPLRRPSDAEIEREKEHVKAYLATSKGIPVEPRPDMVMPVGDEAPPPLKKENKGVKANGSDAER